MALKNVKGLGQSKYDIFFRLLFDVKYFTVSKRVIRARLPVITSVHVIITAVLTEHILRISNGNLILSSQRGAFSTLSLRIYII